MESVNATIWAPAIIDVLEGMGPRYSLIYKWITNQDVFVLGVVPRNIFTTEAELKDVATTLTSTLRMSARELCDPTRLSRFREWKAKQEE